MTEFPALEAQFLRQPDATQLEPTARATHPPRILLLYGSLRERSYSRLLTEAAARLHLARAVTRRAERAAVAANADRDLNPLALTYLNRLSDHLFVLTRHINAAAGGDVLWKPGATR